MQKKSGMKLERDTLVHIINKSLTVFVLLDYPEMRWLEVNEEAKRLFEIEDKQDLCRRGNELLDKHFLIRNQAEIDRSIGHQGFFEAEVALEKASGTKSWGKLRLDKIGDKQEAYYLLQISNLERVKLTEKMLTDENIKFATLFENASIGILMVDDKGCIQLANPFLEKQFGYDPGEIRGKYIEALIPDRYSKKHEMHREKFIEKPQNRPMGIGMSLSGKKKNGMEFPVEISLSHLVIDQNRYVIAYVIDTTLRKEQEDILNKQRAELEEINSQIKRINQELEQKVEARTTMLREALNQLQRSNDDLELSLEKEKELNDMKSRFVSMASHEFRTPLSAILSSASLIEKYPHTEDQEKRDKHTHRIKNSVRNLNNILEDFLSLGRLEEGRISENKEEVSVSQIIQAAVDEVSEIRKEGQQLIVKAEGPLNWYVDKRMLLNILINLLSNGIKYSPENKRIWLSAGIEQENLIIEVKDEGMGISKEDFEHLFERFFRGHNVTNIQGTGLGLNIVRKYLDLMGGKITAASELEKGTTFTITLPKPHK